jgi:release factor glutamine methyltransferase
MTVREALAEGNAALAKAGIETPALDTSLLLAEALHTSRVSLIAAGPDPLAAESLAAFRRLVDRRRSGECAAYILGRKEFYGLDFAVSPEVLVPRPDTETLVEAAIETLRARCAKGGASGGGKCAANGSPPAVLDLCTGSGAIAVSLKHELPELAVWATDISAGALAVATANAARLLPPEPCTPIHFCLGNLYEALACSPPHSPFPNTNTLIISNAPYVPTMVIRHLAPEVRNEPLIALDGGTDGLDIIRNIIDGAPDFLSPGGSLLLEADPSQMHTIAALLAKNGFTGIQTYRDLSNQERVIGGVISAGAPR